MSKARKAVLAGLLLAAIAGLVPSSGGPTAVPAATPAFPLQVPPAVDEAVQSASANGNQSVQVNLMVDSPAAMAGLQQAILQAGGQVLDKQTTILTAKLPASSVREISRSARVVAVGTDQKVDVEKTHPVTQHDAVISSEAPGLASISMDAVGAAQFRRDQSVSGSGVLVAVIDTGVDPGNPALQTTPDGRSKLVDWKDFTGEGNVQMDRAVSWAGTYAAPDGRTFKLPPRPAGSRGARFGFLDEFPIDGLINRDLDRDGVSTDRFGVLLVDAGEPGVFDTVYIDTNNNADFTDEEPMPVFSRSGAVGHMGHIRVGDRAAQRVNVVVADIDPAGKWVSIGFDGMGHGTQVAGVLGAYDPKNGFTGVAPGVQIMALKAIGAGGSGDWFAIKDAIKYAATHGANIINLSIGGLAAAASQFDATASEWLNEITRQYGSLIVLAADNTGPGLSSGTTLGSPSEVLAVGAYYSPEMWKRDFGYVVPHESVWSLSGMGPRSDGSYLPNLVAPGGSPTTSPLWIDPTGYTTKVGTSIATPHVSGAAALLMQAGRQAGTNYDRLSIKRALEMGARRIAFFEVFEQGNGLLQIPVAFAHLRSINDVPALKARSGEGNGGLLARSFAPGSTEFWLTNLGTGLTRIGVYSSETWVRPSLRSLTVPSDVPRRLPLEISPPEETGVHSAFLMVTDQNTYGTSLTIPVTYVRPVELPPSRTGGYSTTDSLEVGRYQRYFFDIKPGTAALNVTARVPINPATVTQGTVQVHVLRPDGKEVYSSSIGAQGQALTAAVTTEYPVEGVWEVVIAADPNPSGDLLTATYTLSAQATPAAMSGLPLHFTMAAGSTASFPVKLSNPSAPFTGRLQGVGLTKVTPERRGDTGVPWQVEQKSQSVIEEFTLDQFTGYMRVEVSNPVPADAGISVSLYYLDRTAGWVLRGQTVAQPSGHEVIEVSNLPTGRYQTVAVVSGSGPAPVQYQYRRLMGVDQFMVSTDDTPSRHDREDVWTPRVTIQAPSAPGRYTGQLLLWDTDKKVTVGWFPFEVSVGQPALTVAPLVAQLTRGQPADVVLQLRDAAGSPVDGTVTVNGRRYVSRGGEVTVSVVPHSDTQVMEVEADLPQFQFFKQQFVLPVRDKWLFHPLGVDSSGENIDWHRKLSSEMP